MRACAGVGRGDVWACTRDAYVRGLRPTCPPAAVPRFQDELDRYCDALIQIRKEIQEVKDGKVSVKDSVLRNAPHTQQTLMADKWDRKYSREQAAYPLPYLRRNKFWPTVGRVNDVFGAVPRRSGTLQPRPHPRARPGDTNLVTKCPDYKIYGKVRSSMAVCGRWARSGRQLTPRSLLQQGF